MTHLPEILQKEKYKKIRFTVSKTNHLLVNASINGVKGRFILDTGASNSCVDFQDVTQFKLTPEHSKTRAAGAGATGMFTQIAQDNILKIGRWQHKSFSLIVFDMSHVNAALKEHKAKPVKGILGADVLMHGKAIVDYANHFVYLK
ncbi:Acid protease [Flavobacterium longum]|uniref:retropepsin-like aspartic protease n=1 Tax=Flavobacterium longum TaxID=1299340 RepID=UPI0039ED6293